MKLLIDANLSPKWIPWLLTHAIDGTHWNEIGPGDAPDSDIMAYAAEHGYIVLTRDLDFGTMLR